MTNKEHLEAIEKLAGVFSDGTAAQRLLDRIDFPVPNRPVFQQAYGFWRQVYNDVKNGLTAGGTEALLREAGALRPHHEYFQRFGSGGAGDDVPSPGDEQHFSQEELIEILDLLTRRNLLDPGTFTTLFATIDGAVVSRLPTDGNPSARALKVLAALNEMPRLANGELPLEQFLRNAAVLSGPFEEAEKLKGFIDRLD